MITYVGVRVEYDLDGNMTPLVIHWPDGRDFEVDCLLSVVPTITVGSGFGNRYLCRVRGKEVVLCRDDVDGRWYVRR